MKTTDKILLLAFLLLLTILTAAFTYLLVNPAMGQTSGPPSIWSSRALTPEELAQAFDADQALREQQHYQRRSLELQADQNAVLREMRDELDRGSAGNWSPFLPASPQRRNP